MGTGQAALAKADLAHAAQQQAQVESRTAGPFTQVSPADAYAPACRAYPFQLLDADTDR